MYIQHWGHPPKPDIVRAFFLKWNLPVYTYRHKQTERDRPAWDRGRCRRSAASMKREKKERERAGGSFCLSRLASMRTEKAWSWLRFRADVCGLRTCRVQRLRFSPPFPRRSTTSKASQTPISSSQVGRQTQTTTKSRLTPHAPFTSASCKRAKKRREKDEPAGRLSF